MLQVVAIIFPLIFGVVESKGVTMRKIKLTLYLLIQITMANYVYADECNYGLIKLNIIADTLYSVILEDNEKCFPNYVFQFKSVKRMDIYNCLYDEVSPEISSMKELSELNISKCRYIDYNKLMINLKNNKLSKLSLNDNDIIHIPDNIRLLQSLKELNMTHNLIDTVPRNLLQMNNLRVLNLHENNVKYFEICDSVNYSIQILILSNNDIHTFPIGLEKLKGLKRLYLNNNPKFDVEEICNFILNFDELEMLDISGCNAKGIPKNIENLKRVSKIVNSYGLFSKDELLELRKMGIKIH